MTNEEILHTEFSEEFVQYMRNRMVVSYYKYGPLAQNARKGMVDEIKTLKKRIEKYEETGNTEYLVDAANFCMIEFMQPQHPNAHFRATDSHESPGVSGVTIREIEQWGKEDYR